MIGNLLSDTGSESDKGRGEEEQKSKLKFSVNEDPYLVENINLEMTAYKKKKKESLLQTLLQMKQLFHGHLPRKTDASKEKVLYVNIYNEK